MEIFKNAEIVLVLLFALLCAAAWVGKPKAPHAIAVDIGSADRMAVVIITGKRLTAEEKRTLM